MGRGWVSVLADHPFHLIDLGGGGDGNGGHGKGNIRGADLLREARQAAAEIPEITQIDLAEGASQEEAERALRALSEDPRVDGILPLVPFPRHISRMQLIRQLDPEKDMDCIHPINGGKLYLGITPWGPCTPRSCMALLDYYKIPLEGQNVVMVGYGEVVGRPLTLMLMGRYATVTVCRSRTKNLPAITRQADIIISAVGKPDMITEDMIREGAVVVDVGINSVDGKLVGDVSEAAKKAKASAYTPVPGGVGVVSNLMVMETLTRRL